MSGFDGHGEELNAIFKLQCNCGNPVFTVHGHAWRRDEEKEDAVFVGPIKLECAECSRMETAFDAEQHGYDVELGHGCYSVSGEGEAAISGCSSCGSTEFRVLARFEYADDMFSDYFADVADRLQDIFTWFTLVGECANCNEQWNIADFECA